MPGQDQHLQRVCAFQALPRRRVGGTWYLPAPAMPWPCCSHCWWVQGPILGSRVTPALPGPAATLGVLSAELCHHHQHPEDEEGGTLGPGAALLVLQPLRESLCSQGRLLHEERLLPSQRRDAGVSQGRMRPVTSGSV